MPVTLRVCAGGVMVSLANGLFPVMLTESFS